VIKRGETARASARHVSWPAGGTRRAAGQFIARTAALQDLQPEQWLVPGCIDGPVDVAAAGAVTTHPG
jgi:hypothetical protein